MKPFFLQQRRHHGGGGGAGGGGVATMRMRMRMRLRLILVIMSSVSWGGSDDMMLASSAFTVGPSLPGGRRARARARAEAAAFTTTPSSANANAVAVAFATTRSSSPPLPPGSREGGRRRRTTEMIVCRSSSSSFSMEPGDDGMVECDVVIVGGGPAGCTCGLYTARASHRTVILDKNPGAGALAITSTIANYPGVDPTTSGEDLLALMRDQAVEYGSQYRQAQVFMLEFGGGAGATDDEGDHDDDENPFDKLVYTPDATYKAKAIVLATGAMGRKPTFRGEAEYLGKGVSYCATCDGAFYGGSEVCVVGTTQEAIDEAEFLTKFASTVHWVTPRAIAQGAHPETLLAHPNVNRMDKTRLLSINGDPVTGVKGVTIRTPEDGSDGSTELENVEGVFIYDAGSKPITDYIGSKLEFKDDGGVKVNDEMSTSVPGVFAIGDIRNTPFKQVVVAAGDGCIAAMAIDRYLKGRKQIRVDWIHQ